METRVLGRTGLRVSVLGLGGGAFSGKDKARVEAACSTAFAGGVTLVDTARDYGEEKLNGVLRKRGRVVVVSKSTAGTGGEMAAAVRSSVEKLGRIDLYMIQTVMSAEDLKRRFSAGVLDALIEARSRGLIKFIGASGHRIPALIEAVETGDIDVVEAPYSIGQHCTDKLIEAARRSGVGVIAMVPLGGGVLVDRDGRCKAAKHMNAGSALSWVLSNDGIACAIAGMSDPEHVKTNLRAAAGLRRMDAGERRRVEAAAVRFLGENFCMSCKACMPCDEFGWAFNIDGFFRFHAWYARYGYSQFRDEYAKLGLKADACTGCGKCEPCCPYGVPIMERLAQVHRDLGA